MTLVSKDVIDRLLMESGGDPQRVSASDRKQSDSGAPALRNIVVDPSRNEALEAGRPGADVFKAIFGSDGEDEDEED
jgi:G patch domain-containing protein 1